MVVGSFLPNSLKQHQRRMNLQQQASAPALPAPVAPPPVLTAAMPISHAAPGNGFHAPPASAMPPQPHANAEHGAMNLNTTGFTMVGWPASSQPVAHRASPSPDINVSLTPQAQSSLFWSPHCCLTHFVGHGTCCPCVTLADRLAKCDLVGRN